MNDEMDNTVDQLSQRNFRPVGYAASHWYSTAAAYYATVTGEPTTLHPTQRPSVPAEADKTERLNSHPSEDDIETAPRRASEEEERLRRQNDDHLTPEPQSSIRRKYVIPSPPAEPSSTTAVVRGVQNQKPDNRKDVRPQDEVRGIEQQTEDFEQQDRDSSVDSKRIETTNNGVTERDKAGINIRKPLAALSLNEQTTVPARRERRRGSSVAEKWKEYSRRCRDAWGGSDRE